MSVAVRRPRPGWSILDSRFGDARSLKRPCDPGAPSSQWQLLFLEPLSK